MGRVHRQRGEDREYRFHEMLFEPFTVGLGQFARLDDEDLFFRKRFVENTPGLLLILLQFGDLVGDGFDLFSCRQAIIGARFHALRYLPHQARNANHEKFVEIVGGNRQETHALKQRMGLVLGFLQHPAVELKP